MSKRVVKIPQKIINIALNESLKTNIKKGRLSCLVLGKKWNILYKTHNIRLSGNKTKFSIHAEERAIIKYRNKINTMMIFRNTQYKNAASSKPCNKCMLRIQQAGVKYIIYFENNKWVKQKA